MFRYACCSLTGTIDSKELKAALEAQGYKKKNRSCDYMFAFCRYYMVLPWISKFRISLFRMVYQMIENLSDNQIDFQVGVMKKVGVGKRFGCVLSFERKCVDPTADFLVFVFILQGLSKYNDIKDIRCVRFMFRLRG